MGIPQALREVGARTETAARWTRWPLERCPPGSQWGAVDLAYGRSLAGSAAAVRSVLDLPPAFPARGAVGGAGGHFMGALRRLAGPRRTRAGRELRRRLVHRGKKGGDRIGPTRCGKGSKIMAIADCHGLPVAVGVTSASPNESTLVEDTLRQRHVSALPKRMIGDRAYDSDRLDERLRREHGIAMIAPNRRRRKRTQDGRPLRRYLRRWKVERLFAEELSPDPGTLVRSTPKIRYSSLRRSNAFGSYRPR